MDFIPCSERLPERGGDTPKYSDDYPVIVETGTGPEFMLAQRDWLTHVRSLLTEHNG